MGLAIGGLSGGSGLDNQTIITQLMTAESGPQSTLKTQLSTNTVKAGAWTSLGTIMAGLQTSAAAIQTKAKIEGTSVSTNASSLMTVSSASTATAGSLTFRINALAAAQQVATSVPITSSTQVVGASTTVITSGTAAVGASSVTAGASAVTGHHTVVVKDAATVTVDGVAASFTTSGSGATSLVLGDGTSIAFDGAPRAGTLSIGLAVTTSDTATMADVANALTAAGGPARAALISTGDSTNPYKMVLSATATGSDGALSITSSVAALDSPTVIRPAQDAEIVLGTGADALTIHRSSNTITDLMPGVTISLTKADPTTDATVTVGRDDDTTVKNVQTLVDSLNSTLGWIATNSKYDVSTSSGGPMVGDNSVRDLASQVVDAMRVQPGTANVLKTAGQLGITIQKDGTYAFDATVLRDQLAADPDAVSDVIGSFSNAVYTVAKAATDTGGVVDVGKASTAANATDLQSKIDDWDLKLKNIQTRYEKTFSDLDVAMSLLKSQLASLTSSIGSLPTSSSS